MRIVVGYDKRCWATFTVKDATPEETNAIADMCEDLGPHEGELLRQMEREGRLIFDREDEDDHPDFFAPFARPSLIEREDD